MLRETLHDILFLHPTTNWLKFNRASVHLIAMEIANGVSLKNMLLDDCSEGLKIQFQYFFFFPKKRNEKKSELHNSFNLIQFETNNSTIYWEYSSHFRPRFHSCIPLPSLLPYLLDFSSLLLWWMLCFSRNFLSWWEIRRARWRWIFEKRSYYPEDCRCDPFRPFNVKKHISIQPTFSSSIADQKKPNDIFQMYPP